MSNTTLVWERVDGVDYDEDYALEAHVDSDHFYFAHVLEPTVDLPEAEHRFDVSWIDLATDADEHFGRNLTRLEALELAEQHAARHGHKPA